MNKFLFTAGLGASALTFVLYAGWTTPRHLSLVAASTLASLPAVLFLRKRLAQSRQRKSGKPRRPTGPAISLLSGIGVGFTLGLWNACFLLVFALLPSPDFYRDWDRFRVEAAINALERMGHLEDAVATIEERLTLPLSRAWRHELLARSYSDLIAASKRATDDGTKQKLLNQAIHLAKKNGLDSALAEAFLESVSLRGLKSSDAENLKKQIQSLQVGQKEKEREFERVAAQYRDQFERLAQGSREVEASRAALMKTWAEKLVSVLVRSGDLLEEKLVPRQAQYLAALELSDQHQLESAAIRKRLEDLAIRIAASRPRALPSGASVHVKGVALDAPPIGTIDLEVLDANDGPIADLTVKDFQIIGKSRALPPLAVGLRRPPAHNWKLAVLFDHSGSTQGAAIEQAKEGTVLFAKALEGRASFRLVSFSGEVTVSPQWMKTADEIRSALQLLKPMGGTALYRAIAVALDQLEAEKGSRAILLFTDGGDTVGGTTAQALIERCHELAIPIHVVALETKDLDRPAIEQLARETQGSVTAVADAGQLARHFLELAKRWQTPCYRLFFEVPNQESHVRVAVGSSNAVVANVALEVSGSGNGSR